MREGSYKLRFQHVSYITQFKNINLKGKNPLEINIDMLPKEEVLETIVLSAGKFEQRLEEARE